jgi:hypothetical protein
MMEDFSTMKGSIKDVVLPLSSSATSSGCPSEEIVEMLRHEKQSQLMHEWKSSIQGCHQVLLLLPGRGFQ